MKQGCLPHIPLHQVLKMCLPRLLGAQAQLEIKRQPSHSPAAMSDLDVTGKHGKHYSRAGSVPARVTLCIDQSYVMLEQFELSLPSLPSLQCLHEMTLTDGGARAAGPWRTSRFWVSCECAAPQPGTSTHLNKTEQTSICPSRII